MADGTIKIAVDLDSSQLEQELGKMGSVKQCDKKRRFIPIDYSVLMWYSL